MKLKIFLLILFAHGNLFAAPIPKSVIARRQQSKKAIPSSRSSLRKQAPSFRSPRSQSVVKGVNKRTKKKSSPCVSVTLESFWYSNEAYSCRPPQSWQCIQEKAQLSETVDVLFIGQGKGGLTPTIHIAQEITPKSILEYIEEVLAYHKQNNATLETSVFTQIPAHNCHFYILKTEMNTSWGRVFCLQAITIVNHVAYVLTSNSAQEDYPDVSLLFLKTVASFKLAKIKEESGDTVLENALKALQNEQSLETFNKS